MSFLQSTTVDLSKAYLSIDIDPSLKSKLYDLPRGSRWPSPFPARRLGRFPLLFQPHATAHTPPSSDSGASSLEESVNTPPQSHIQARLSSPSTASASSSISDSFSSKAFSITTKGFTPPLSPLTSASTRKKRLSQESINQVDLCLAEFIHAGSVWDVYRARYADGSYCCVKVAYPPSYPDRQYEHEITQEMVEKGLEIEDRLYREELKLFQGKIVPVYGGWWSLRGIEIQVMELLGASLGPGGSDCFFGLPLALNTKLLALYHQLHSLNISHVWLSVSHVLYTDDPCQGTENGDLRLVDFKWAKIRPVSDEEVGDTLGVEKGDIELYLSHPRGGPKRHRVRKFDPVSRLYFSEFVEIEPTTSSALPV